MACLNCKQIENELAKARLDISIKRVQLRHSQITENELHTEKLLNSQLENKVKRLEMSIDILLRENEILRRTGGKAPDFSPGMRARIFNFFLI